MRRKLFVFMLSIAALIFISDTAFSQGFPNKPLRIIAAQTGGAGDVVVRAMQPALSAILKQPIIIENRGGGVLAGETLSKSAPDGHTLLVFANTLWLLPHMRSKMPYDPLKDFTPVSVLTETPQVLAIHPKVPVKSVKELIAYAKANPDKLNYASAASGTINHLSAELFKSMAGVDIHRIAFKGTADALNALIAGETDMMFPNPANALPFAKAGRLKVLAVTSEEPSPSAPGVPTMSAAGLPGFVTTSMFVMFAPAKTPAPIIKQLNQAVVQALNTPDVKERLTKMGADVIGNSPEQAKKAVDYDSAMMGKVIKDANIRDE